MPLIDILLLAVALAMDCFAVSIAAGLFYHHMPHATRSTSHLTSHTSYLACRMSLLFGVFQALMPLLGWLLTIGFSHHVAEYGRWIAFALLGFIGGRMVYESLRPQKEAHFDPQQLTTQLVLAVATSIDALSIGVTMAFTGYARLVQLLFPLSTIGLVSLLFALLGHWVGLRFGRITDRHLQPELLGGIILISIGLKILLV